MLTVSTLHPLAVDRTLNVVEFFLPPRKSPPSSPSSSRPRRPPATETFRIEDDETPSAWTAAAGRFMNAATTRSAPQPQEGHAAFPREWYRRIMDSVPNAEMR